MPRTKNSDPNSLMIIKGDRSLEDFMGILKRDREWREVEPQPQTPNTVYKDNVIKFPITSNLEILTPIPPKNIA